MRSKLIVATALAICLGSRIDAATFTVTSNDDSGPGTLRQAIIDANATAEADTIAFALVAAPTISLHSELPVITQPLTVDGTTQPGSPLVHISSSYYKGFIIDAPDTTIRGLHLYAFSSAIEIRGAATGRRIVGNWIGDWSGRNFNGILLERSWDASVLHTVIGGTTPADRNIISGNKCGINAPYAPFIVIQGNYIGPDSSGTTPIGNDVGIYTHQNTVIGGTSPGAGNVISGNKIGVEVFFAQVSTPSIVGNLIGVAADGVTPMPNQIGIRSDSELRVGGLENGARNVVAWNTVAGMEITDWSTANVSNSWHHNKVALNVISGLTKAVLAPPVNDPGDMDEFANRPVIANVQRGQDATVIRGRLHGRAGTTYALQFFANQHDSWQGETLLGTVTVTPGADHEAPFTASVAPTTSCCITATATMQPFPYPWRTSFYSRGYSVRRDFNGDFKTDIWWRNSQTGENAIWFMDGHRVIGGRNLPAVGSEWQAIVADYDGDTHSDVFWHHTLTGENAIWYLRDGYIDMSRTFVPPPMPVEWEPLAIDADGDSRAEVLWRNPSSGEQQLWRMAYSYPWWVAAVPWLPGDWTRTAAAMGLTGFDSILWRSESNSATQVWDMSTGTVTGGGVLPSVGDQWEMIAGDFNGDTNADILWRHKATGQLSMWLLRGTTIIGGSDLYPVGTPWEPILGDFNGDGRCDVLWHRSDTGQNSLWLLDGWRIIGGGDAPYVPGSHWSAVR